LILAVAISIVLYVLVGISAVSVVGWEKLAASDAPFSDLAYSAFGSWAFMLLSWIALFATANTVLMMLLGASRIIYGMADSLTLPYILARVHLSRRTPWVAIFLAMALSMVFIFAGDIAFVANVDNFTLFVTFFVINAALILLRYREPQVKRPFRIPFTIGKFPILPLFGILFCIFMLMQLEWKVLFVGMVLVALGGILSFVEMNKK